MCTILAWVVWDSEQQLNGVQAGLVSTGRLACAADKCASFKKRKNFLLCSRLIQSSICVSCGAPSWWTPAVLCRNILMWFPQQWFTKTTRGCSNEVEKAFWILSHACDSRVTDVSGGWWHYLMLTSHRFISIDVNDYWLLIATDLPWPRHSHLKIPSFNEG